ncbi:putative head morphogenesis domain protein [Vibrio phage vB_VpaS_KF4]|nr:putative head morphogenesis domain protein [Vibrio phage vB_VpaS_KF3]ATI19241.1 putative head morphogenesis domain protein [Vibrio phage vB_VpaS_KF4]
MANFSDNLAVVYADHQIDLYRYEANQRQDIAAFLLAMADEIRDSLLRADFGSQSFVTKRKLNQLLKEIELIIKQYYKDARDYQLGELRELSTVEYNWAIQAMNNALHVEVFERLLTDTFLESVVSNVLIEGAPSKEWWARQATDTLEKFTDQIRMGVALGETNDQLIERVIGKFQGEFVKRKLASGKEKRFGVYEGGILKTSRTNAETLVRSSVQAIANDAKMRLYAANDDLMYGYQHLSVLDLKTSDICIARSGLAWTVEGKPIGKHKKRFRIPPLHWNCRSLLMPILKSWQDLPDKVRTSLPGSMQASMDGLVSADQTYEDMLKRRTDAEVKKKLGPGRFELWKQGKLTLRDLTDQDDRPLTLKEYRERV